MKEELHFGKPLLTWSFFYHAGVDFEATHQWRLHVARSRNAPLLLCSGAANSSTRALYVL